MTGSTGGHGSTDPSDGGEGDGKGVADGSGDELPADVVEDVERLTRFERNAVDEREAERYAERRDALLEECDFTARIREDEDGETLVLYPEEWVEGGVVRTDRIEDVSRAVELPLDGAGDPEEWAAVDAKNRELVAAVRDEHGDVHGDNAAALADFVGNHYAKRIERTTAEELAEFRTEYFVRNAWPSEEQVGAIDDSLEMVFETAGEPLPPYREATPNAGSNGFESRE